MGLDAILTIGALIVPPVFDFIKKKFIKSGNDTPEATMSSLATTKPEALAPYVTALSGYIKAQIGFFNRDVYGELPKWICGLRALIRPAVVVVGLIHLTLHGIFGKMFVLEEGTRYFYEITISSWFGTKITKD